MFTEFITQLSVINNGTTLQYGTIQSNITLPVAFNSVIRIVTGNTKNRTDGAVATYNDISMWSGACLNITLTSCQCRGSGWYIAIGF